MTDAASSNGVSLDHLRRLIAAGEREAAVGHELGEQLRVVDHLVVTLELWVLVLQRVEAVRALRQHGLQAQGVIFQQVRGASHLQQQGTY